MPRVGLPASAHTIRVMNLPLTPHLAAAPTGLGQGLGLGLDAGGTQTRWALADAQGAVLAQGEVAALSGLQLETERGQEEVRQTLLTLASVTRHHGALRAVVAGVTGFDAQQVPLLCRLVAQALGVAEQAVSPMSDIELACHAAFAPGQGYVVYAGTGSIAAFLDADGVLQRAGGRGAVIDDAGGGHWIARQALCQIWRAEDEAPGAWRTSPLALQVFERIGGADWALTRQWVYGASRGELGLLALAVAAAADEDAVALALLQQAGVELARLGQALWHRHGARRLALAGRVLDLHPVVESSLRAALPQGAQVHRLQRSAHHAAALLAARKEI